MFIKGQRIINGNSDHATGEIYLEAGKQVALLIEYKHRQSTGKCRLLWSVPDPSTLDAQKVIDRVRNEGTNLIIIESSADWMDIICQNTAVRYAGKFAVGINWLGGSFFVKSHSLFKGLPVNQGMNWPYQDVVNNGNERMGLQIEGEELVAGVYHSYPFKLGTGVGVIPLGKGKIIFSTLNIVDNLHSKATTASVAKKLLCNYIDFGWNN